MITKTGGKCVSGWKPCSTIDCTSEEDCHKHKDPLNPYGNTCLRSIIIFAKKNKIKLFFIF